MSCIITYNGQNFTQEDFLDYLKSQIPSTQFTSRVQIWKGFWSRKDVENNSDKIFLFGDNFEDARTGYVPSSTQAVIRGLPNAIGISTKNNRGTNEGIIDRDDYQESSYLDNQDFEMFKKHVDKQISKAIDSGKTIVLPEDGIGTGKAELKERAPKLFEYLNQELEKLKSTVPVKFIDQIEARDHFNFQNSETLLQSVVSHPDIPQYLKDLAKQLLDKVNVKDINIETYAGNLKSVGLYNNTTNTVTINLRQFIENKTSTIERISETIVHEYIHAATVKGLKEFKAGTNDNVHLKNINTLFEQYRKDLIKEAGYQEFLKFLEKVKTKQDLTIAERQKGRELQNKYYAALKVEEFVTMGLSNPTTRETLKSKNLLQKLFDSIAFFLGLDNNMFTLLEQEYNKYLDSVNNNKQTFQEDNISNLDTYQYYGKTYQIHTVDGVGVKVEGYMGSNVKQQALLAAYNNNKDIDPQTGRKFRNLSSLEELEQKITGNGIGTSNTLNLSKYELFPGVYANEGQKAAIDAIEEFLAGDKELFLLKGRGGTGKTTIVKKTIGEIPVKKVAGATIAYEAKNVLQENMAGYNTFTMASLIGLMPDWAKDGTMFFREKTIAERINPYTGEISPLPIEGKKLIIVDEASMIDSFIYEKLLEKKDKDAKILFMGDNVQIPPINSRVDEDGNVIDSEEKDSPVWELVESGDYVELSERMRQGAESPILPITDLYAENVENLQNNRPGIDNPLKDRNSNFENNEGVLFTTDINEVTDQFIEDVRSSTDIREAVIVGARNAVVDEINDKVRNKLFETNEAYVIGDRLRVNSPYMEDKDLIYPNGLRVEVLAVREINTSDLGFKMFELKTSYTEIAENGSKKNIISFMRTISPKDKSLFNKKIKEMAAKAKSLPKGSLESKKAWKQFFDIKNSVVDLGYGYAITAHKVQGSTYNSTYVLEGDIMSFPGGVEQRNRMMYTAVSRPRKKLVIFNPSKVENKTTTSKPQSKDFITNKVNSSFDKYGYVDILTSGKNNFDFKSAVIKYILKDLGLEFKSDKELNNYLIKEKNEGRTFNLMQYVTLEELPDNKTRVKLNKRNLLLDSVEDFGPKSLGGLNFTSSGRDFESKNMFKNNIEQAFNCK